MALSMTGWGTHKAEGYSINIRGLNSKYKEVLLHLPPEFFCFESEIHRRINDAITRGRVDVYVNMDKDNLRREIKIDDNLFKSGYKAFEKIYKKAGIRKKPEPETVIRCVEGIVKVNESIKGDYKWETVKPSFEKALSDFMLMKEREGSKLSSDILARAEAIEAEAAAIKADFESFREVFAKKTREKIEKIIVREDAKKFLSSEIVEAVDKHDISEELVRISSHVTQLKEMLLKEQRPGRKIDFLAQELYRESNTIASKIQDAPVAHRVISMKENTEKIREQAQNLE